MWVRVPSATPFYIIMDNAFIKSLVNEKYFGDLIFALDDPIVKKALSDDYMLCLSIMDEFFERICLADPVSDYEKDKKASIQQEIMKKINLEED